MLNFASWLLMEGKLTISSVVHGASGFLLRSRTLAPLCSHTLTLRIHLWGFHRREPLSMFSDSIHLLPLPSPNANPPHCLSKTLSHSPRESENAMFQIPDSDCGISVCRVWVWKSMQADLGSAGRRPSPSPASDVHVLCDCMQAV